MNGSALTDAASPRQLGLTLTEICALRAIENIDDVEAVDRLASAVQGTSGDLPKAEIDTLRAMAEDGAYFYFFCRDFAELVERLGGLAIAGDQAKLFLTMLACERLLAPMEDPYRVVREICILTRAMAYPLYGDVDGLCAMFTVIMDPEDREQTKEPSEGWENWIRASGKRIRDACLDRLLAVRRLLGEPEP